MSNSESKELGDGKVLETPPCPIHSANPRASLDALPTEVQLLILDAINEQLAGEYYRSFKALSQTCRALRTLHQEHGSYILSLRAKRSLQDMVSTFTKMQKDVERFLDSLRAPTFTDTIIDCLDDPLFDSEM